MQILDGRTIFSATDLTSFMECRHKVGLDLDVANGARARISKDDRSEEVDIIPRHGLAHERRYLERLRAEGREVLEIADGGRGSVDDLERAATSTLEAMRSGAEVISQGVFFDGLWLGYADFLMRVDRPSRLGSHSYEAHDTKLARSTKVSALIQLAEYSAHLERLQGDAPKMMHVVLGDGTTESVPTTSAAAFHRRLRRRFLEAVHTDLTAVYPMKVSHCAICDWAPQCEQRRVDDDHLSLLPGTRRDQVAKVEAAGIHTVGALAGQPQDLEIPRLAASATLQLQSLARLQIASRKAGRPEFEHKPVVAPSVRTGFALLPPPDVGDLFFDLEGDPFLGENGREYLWGWCDNRGVAGYVAVWGHTPETEKRAVEEFIDVATATLASTPEMHVYHYADYEVTVLKRLTAVYGTRQSQLDDLLRAEIFVDLHRVARQALWVSTSSYSIKELEKFYRRARQTNVQSGMASVVSYEQWLDTGDPALLHDIEHYNRDDCVSTLELRDWLMSIRPSAVVDTPRQDPSDGVEDPRASAADDRQQLTSHQDALGDRLEAIAAEAPPADARSLRLVAALLGFHHRENRPDAWSMFARQNMTDAELVGDADSIGRLTYAGPVGSVAKSTRHRYDFDANQPFKLKVGDKPLDPDTLKGTGTIHALDSNEGTLELKVSNAHPAPTAHALIPSMGPPTASLERALLDLGDEVAAVGCTAPGRFRAARALVGRHAPSFSDRPVGQPLVPDDADPAQMLPGLATSLHDSYLAVQGPPGSGKSHAGAQLICALVAQGHRVGVTANSHPVVAELLMKVTEAAEGAFAVLKVGGSFDTPRVPFDFVQQNSAAVRATLLGPDTPAVVGGSAWLFAHEDLREHFDVLVIDEAGQLSLASALAASTAAKNIVLLGDPQQLDQPVKGSHPPGSAMSALGHLIGDHHTVSPELGVFLDRTWRMHPDVSAPVSSLAYEGRLRSRPHCAEQRLTNHGTGIRYIPVEHFGCRNESPAEAARIVDIVDALLEDSWIAGDGQTRSVTADDIVVMAPYNAHVRCLTEALGDKARVGTVDKFQGQEAAVAIYSMAASSAEDIPRGLEFQFSINRLNVALSRAKCLSILVGSDRLLDAKAHNLGQLTLVSALCELVERARPHGLDIDA